MKGSVEEARRFATAALVAVAEPEKSEGMQAYMKTDMPLLRGAEACPDEHCSGAGPGLPSAGRSRLRAVGARSLGPSPPGGEVSGARARPTLRGVS